MKKKRIPLLLFISARAAFNAFDFLGEGYIAANDIKEALTQVMDESDEKEIHAIIKHFRYIENRTVRPVINKNG